MLYMCATINPSKIMGGGVSAAGTFLLDRIQVFFSINMFSHQLKTPLSFVLAELGNVLGSSGRLN